MERRLADDGSGFGNPIRDWIHDSIANYYESGRDEDALMARLARAMEGGIGYSDWKREREPSLRRMLTRFAQMEPKGRGIVQEVLYQRRPDPVAWRGHGLAIPLSLLVEHLGRPLVRVVWTESGFRFKSRGATMVAVATLAYAETLLDLRISGIEVWQLRDGQQRHFDVELLQARYPMLDDMLTFAERRLGQPPAA